MRCSAAILCMGLYLGGCEADHPCDKGQTYSQGVCTPASSTTPDAGTMPETKDAGDEKYSGDGQCAEDQSKVLWSSCEDDSGCNCAAPYCAVMPGSPMGYCTLHCHPMGTDCPDGYRCFDLSALGVTGYDPFCIKN
jgi:hypothetical protein